MVDGFVLGVLEKERTGTSAIPEPWLCRHHTEAAGSEQQTALLLLGFWKVLLAPRLKKSSETCSRVKVAGAISFM